VVSLSSACTQLIAPQLLEPTRAVAACSIGVQLFVTITFKVMEESCNDFFSCGLCTLLTNEQQQALKAYRKLPLQSQDFVGRIL